MILKSVCSSSEGCFFHRLAKVPFEGREAAGSHRILQQQSSPVCAVWCGEIPPGLNPHLGASAALYSLLLEMLPLLPHLPYHTLGVVGLIAASRAPKPEKHPTGPNTGHNSCLRGGAGPGPGLPPLTRRETAPRVAAPSRCLPLLRAGTLLRCGAARRRCFTGERLSWEREEGNSLS